MKHLYSFLLSALVCLSLSAQNKVSGDSLAADFHYLVKQLELRIPIRTQVSEAKSSSISKRLIWKMSYVVSPHTLQEFWDKSMAFLSFIQDGHTYLFLLRPSSNRSRATCLLGSDVFLTG